MISSHGELLNHEHAHDLWYPLMSFWHTTTSHFHKNISIRPDGRKWRRADEHAAVFLLDGRCQWGHNKWPIRGNGKGQILTSLKVFGCFWAHWARMLICWKVRTVMLMRTKNIHLALVASLALCCLQDKCSVTASSYMYLLYLHLRSWWWTKTEM